MITNVFDFNRDGLVDSADELLTRNNRRLLSSALPLISTPGFKLMVNSDSPTVGLAGEVVRYTYKVQNTGTAMLSNIAVTSAGVASGVRQADSPGGRRLRCWRSARRGCIRAP